MAEQTPTFDQLRAEASFDDFDTLARTVYGEARGESAEGRIAVAHVILNRVKVARAHGGYWWGDTIAGVCRKRWQFSCWNQNDPNREKLLEVGADSVTFVGCLAAAHAALTGDVPDPTDGATHYHTQAVRPEWANGRSPVAVIGHHSFYRDVG